MSRRGPTEAMVRIGQRGDLKEVLIRGAKALNRGIHGDAVAGCDCGSVLPGMLALSSHSTGWHLTRFLHFRSACCLGSIEMVYTNLLCSAPAAEGSVASVHCNSARQRGGCSGGLPGRR